MIAGRVAALAGRRIDEPNAVGERFPLRNVSSVRRRLSEVFRSDSVSSLVCSAACGADLIALEEAGRLGIRRRVVLPFDVARFRETSVLDRPGSWGEVFDHIVGEVRGVGDLVILPGEPKHKDVYELVTRTIIRQALALCRPENSSETIPQMPLAIVVWEGAERGPDDATESFRRLASEQGFESRTVLTV